MKPSYAPQMTPQEPAPDTPKQVLILGGGFAGVYTARYLEKLLRAEEASITLINRENYWVYQPMLPEVISGSIGLTNVVSPIRRLCPRTNLIMREVEDIDLQKGCCASRTPTSKRRRGATGGRRCSDRPHARILS